MFISYDETPLPIEASDNLVKPCSALLCVLLVCIHSYLKSFLSYKFIILDTRCPDYIYVSKDVKICGYFSKPYQSASKRVWETLA
jgi:hypothetical protein